MLTSCATDRLLKEGRGAKALVHFEKALMLAKFLGNRTQERRAVRGLAAASRIQVCTPDCALQNVLFWEQRCVQPRCDLPHSSPLMMKATIYFSGHMLHAHRPSTTCSTAASGACTRTAQALPTFDVPSLAAVRTACC